MSPRIARSARSRLDRFRARIAERIEGHEVQDIEQALSLAERIEQREFGGSAAEKLSYEAVGESRRAQYRCEQFKVFQSHGEILVHDRAVCMGVFRDILVDPDDIETLERFGRASRAIAESVALYAAAVPRFGVDLSEGLPISARYLGLDAPFELVLASVETDTIVSETLFDVPGEADREIDLKTSIMSPR